MKPVPHYVKSLAMAVPAILIGFQIPAWIGFFLSSDRQLRADFRAYYGAGVVLRTSGPFSLYDPSAPIDLSARFIHPAYEAVLFYPLSFFSMKVAHALWALVCVFLIYGIYRAVLADMGHLRELLPWLPLALMISFSPVPYNLMQGQDSLLLLLLIAVALTKLREGKLFLAGIFLGLGVFRFQFLMVVVLLFLCWKAWRMIAGFAITAGTMLLLSLAMVGKEGLREYGALLRRLAVRSQQPEIHMANLRALLAAIHVDSRIFLLAASTCVLVLVARMGWRRSWSDRMLLAVCCGCLLSYHFFLHDLSLLIIPIIFALNRTLARQKYWMLILSVSALAFPTLLAMFGLPIWANVFASVLVLVGFHLIVPTCSQSLAMSENLLVRAT